MKTWLKYGLWFSGIYLAIFFLTLILIAFTNTDLVLWIGVPAGFLTLPGIILSFAIFGVYDGLYHSGGLETTVSVIFSALIYFLIGGGVGKLMDKIRSKK